MASFAVAQDQVFVSRIANPRHPDVIIIGAVGASLLRVWEPTTDAIGDSKNSPF